MTIMNQQGTERVLGRRTDRLWDLLQSEWAGDDEQRWKQLACIHLRLHCDWSFLMISRVMGHTAGHTQRLVYDGMAALERECASPSVRRVLDEEATATAQLIPVDLSELQRRIIHCRQELEVWQHLRDERLKRRSQRPAVRLRIVPGSLRQRIAQLLEDSPPKRWRTIARKLREEAHVVLKTLWACPEFVCDSRGDWSLHRFRGQERLGIDVESAPAKRKPRTGAA